VGSLEREERESVGEELKLPGWGRKALKERRKGHEAKVRIAARLRRETTMTAVWVAERSRIGTAAHVAQLLDWRGRDRKSQNTMF